MEDTTQCLVPHTLLESVKKVEEARWAIRLAANALSRFQSAQRARFPQGVPQGHGSTVRSAMEAALDLAEAARTLQITYEVERNAAAAEASRGLYVGIIECEDDTESVVALPVRIQASTEAQADTKLRALFENPVRLAALFPGHRIPERYVPQGCYLVGEDAPLL